MKATIKLPVLGLLAAVLLSACGGAGPKKVSYTLLTTLKDGEMAMVGVGGDIDGVKSPTLHATVGETVEITLTSGDVVEHDISFPDFNALSERVMGQGSTATLIFVADKSGTFIYTCTIPGHADAGLKGTFVVSEPAP